jgi:hypothetical protein
MVLVRILLLRCYDGVYLVSSLTFAPKRQYSHMQTAANLSLSWGVQLNEKMTKD